MPKQKRTIPRCHSVPSFFEQPTSTWSIERFLLWHIRKCPGDEFRNATNRWVKSLSAISSCNRNCCTEEARKKAAELLQDYRSPGDGSDKSAASRFWSNRGTVNFGTVFQAPVGTASVSQTIHATDSNVESRRDFGDQLQVIDTGAVNTGGEDAEDFDSLTFTTLDKVYPDFEQVIEQFTAQYRAMSEGGKLKLSTNTIVEDVIYQKSKDLAAIIQPHFWILDPQDPDVQPWFTTEEWDELKSERLPLQRPDTNMVSQMAKFAGAKSLADYRAIAEIPPPRPDGVYNFERDFDACWVNEVILKMVTLLERHDLLSSPDLQEGVFDSIIWSPLLDQCLLSLKSLLLQRKEITCRSLDSTLSTDPEFKFDGLVVSLTPRSNRRDRLEFAALEVSKASIAVESNKWVHDSMKVVVGLRAILSRLKRLAKGKDVRRLRVPGSVHAGLNARFAQMVCANENVYWLEWGQVRSVPTTVPMLKKVFELMVSIWHFKTMIRDCFEVVQEHLNPEEQTPNELFEHLMARESGL